MKPEDLEAVFEALARQIDAVGAGKSEVMLAKLALLLAQEIGEAAPVLRAIADSGRSLDL